VHRDEPFHPPLQQKLRVVARHGCVMPMNDRQKKIIVLAEIALNSAYDHGAVGVPDLLDEESNGVGALLAQRSGQEIRTVVQFLGCCLDPLSRVLRNGARGRGIVQDRRDGAGRQADTFRNIPQRDSSRLAEARFFSFSHPARLSQTAHDTSALGLAYRNKQSTWRSGRGTLALAPAARASPKIARITSPPGLPNPLGMHR